MNHPFRQIHLDFHTSPDIPDVGADWNADEFVDTLKAAKVQSINLFAKCHHGLSYYPTEVGLQHPSLKFDLLGEQIESCRGAGIQCPVYVSVCWDVRAGTAHPEWRQVDSTGRHCGAKATEAGWPFLCVNTGYVDELVAQTEELLHLYDVDGFWYDILFYDGDACHCEACRRSMAAALLDPTRSEDVQTNRLQVARAFMAQMARVVRSAKPEAGLFFNGRTGWSLFDEAKWFTQAEIEALPTGGWNYAYYPFWSRALSKLPLPHLGMTGRFHNAWADWGGLKHVDALIFEVGGILATGGRVCVGDQLHPRGRLDPQVYHVIGEAFEHVERLEPYCRDAQPQTEVALLCCPERSEGVGTAHVAAGFNGAAKMLQELHAQFAVVTPETFSPDSYKVVVLPDQTSSLATPLLAKLRTFLEGGGKILSSGTALLDRQAGRFALEPETGIAFGGESPFDVEYFAVEPEEWQSPGLRPGFRYYLGAYSTVILSGPAEARVWATTTEPYFSRTWEHFCSHGLTPPAGESPHRPAILETDNELRIFGPVFQAYWEKGAVALREVVGQCLRRLLPTPLLETDAPSPSEVTLLKQGDRHVVHLVNFSSTRPGSGYQPVLEAPVPLRDVLIGLRLPGRPALAKLGTTGEALRMRSESSLHSVTVPRVGAHEVVCFEP